jgi:hypothetical protein
LVVSTKHLETVPMLPIPPILMPWLAPFATVFTRPTWERVLVLVIGTVLAPGRRTVTAALSVLGRRGNPDFARLHDVLNRARWSGLAAARTLLRWLVAVFVPDGPVVVGIDETIERRWGPKITARGIYRDPVRSSHGHFVKASGLRWISVMLLAQIPWAGRVWALPVLTALAPSERCAQQAGRRHKPLTDWGRQMLLLVGRWLPGRRIIAVADTTYAAIEMLAAGSRWSRACAWTPGCSTRRHRAGPMPRGAPGFPVSASRPWYSVSSIRPAAGAASSSATGMAVADENSIS